MSAQREMFPEQESLFTVEERDQLEAIAAQTSPADLAAVRELRLVK